MKLPATISLPTAAIITQKELQARLGNPTQMTLWRWTKSKQLPHPMRSNGRANIYIISELEQALHAHGIEVVRDDYQ